MPAAAIPGGEIDFLKADKPPTKNRSLDHIAFEVKTWRSSARSWMRMG
jgi:hypothetical protein